MNDLNNLLDKLRAAPSEEADVTAHLYLALGHLDAAADLEPEEEVSRELAETSLELEDHFSEVLIRGIAASARYHATRERDL